MPMLQLDPTLISYQVAASILIILIIVIASLFQIRDLLRIFVTFLIALLAILHYAILYHMSQYEEIRVLPLFVVEEFGGYSAISPDYGQIAALACIYLWRKEIAGSLKRSIKRSGPRPRLAA